MVAVLIGNGSRWGTRCGCHQRGEDTLCCTIHYFIYVRSSPSKSVQHCLMQLHLVLPFVLPPPPPPPPHTHTRNSFLCRDNHGGYIRAKYTCNHSHDVIQGVVTVHITVGASALFTVKTHFYPNLLSVQALYSQLKHTFTQIYYQYKRFIHS